LLKGLLLKLKLNFTSNTGEGDRGRRDLQQKTACLYCYVFITAIPIPTSTFIYQCTLHQQSSNILTDIINCNSSIQSALMGVSQSLHHVCHYPETIACGHSPVCKLGMKI